MPLSLQWAGEELYDRVAETRMLCYAPATNVIDRYREGIRKDVRGQPGDFLLATRDDGRDVGTSTSLSMKLWIRGGCVPCQGVAYVGTIKTARRLGGSGGEAGIATQLMHETLRRGREREQVVSALMPFRASFYEHFGYGNAERRASWTIPLSIVPKGDFSGIRFWRPSDKAAINDARQRECAGGQCDIESMPSSMDSWIDASWPEYMAVVDADGDSIHGFLLFVDQRGDTTATVEVPDWCADSPAALRKLFYFLASLKDQYTFVKMTLPGDYAVNRLLKESQVPHRQVDHPVPSVKPYTRMQIRVLDHKRFLESITMPASMKGKIAVSVRECEGEASRFTMDMNAGRIAVAPSTHTADVEMSDVLWASIVSGDLPAGDALRLGLISPSTKRETIDLLDGFSIGPAPFCQEYF